MEQVSIDWAEQEFCNINFNDKRLLKRFKYIIKKFMQEAQTNISSCFDNWPSIKACYRFFSNSKVESSVIFQEHKNSTISRIIKSEEKILVAHDTTYIDYKTRKKNTTLDKVFRSQNGKDGSLGLILHNSFALTESGIPMGLLNQKFVRRETIKNLNGKILKSHYCHTKPITEKESYRWIECINNIEEQNIKNKDVIHIADREADFYELYKNCNKKQIKFLIRASKNRTINKAKRREKPKYKLFDYFELLPPVATTQIKFQVNKDKKYRQANLSISFKEFTFSPPPNRTIKKDGVNLESIKLFGILAKENNPPVGEAAIKWLLITNIEVNNAEEAIEKILWYTNRWNIEIFHKILKSGCSIETAQLRNRERLIKYITVKSIIAWRIFWLARVANIDKKINCNEILTILEQKILFKRFNDGAIPDREILAMEAIKWIAKLGGYIGRNSDPPPGIISLWKGWTRLMNMVDDYKILTNSSEYKTYG